METDKRIEKILKQSDRQQKKVFKLYEKIDELYQENLFQQNYAKKKLEKLIINDFPNKTDIIYRASDVLSGDFYSILKLEKGILLYMIDGQGHGVTPALTIFSVASTMLHLRKQNLSFEKIISTLFEEIKKFLDEDEQLTYCFIYLENNKLLYTAGGAYPFYVKTTDDVLKFKSNNIPFMNFSKLPKIKEVELKNTKEILLYSDGLVEDLELRKYHPTSLIENSNKIEDLKKEIYKIKKTEDDVTVLSFKN